MFHRSYILIFGVLFSGAGCAAAGGSAGCSSDIDCVDDGVYCNGPMVCQTGICVQGAPPTCEDGVACTQDSCSAESDACQHVPNPALCPTGTVCAMGMGCVTAAACEFDSDCGGDGVYCNGDEVCVNAMCTSPGMRACDDGDSCTVEACDEASRSCTHLPAEHLSDPAHCGPSGQNDCVVCPSPSGAQAHMRAGCVDGACALQCDDGYFDSDADPANGCECASGTGEDEPDAEYRDSNCDGIDGDRSRGILVSESMGNDTQTCGLELDRPCRTIAHAMTRAIAVSRRDLFLMAGTYEEIVVLRDGIRIFGGYDALWARGPRSDAEHRTEITGRLSPTEGQYVTIVAHDLVVAPMLENLVIIGPQAEIASMSSYAVHVVNTDGLQLIRSAVIAGHGADGAPGMVGVDANTLDATVGMQGGPGGMAEAYITTCDNFTRGAGGTAGANTCSGPSSALPGGGAGGAGGVMDNTCDCFIVCVCDGAQCTASGGSPGTPAAQSVAAGYGHAGPGATASCLGGMAGGAGRVRNGAGGVGAVTSRGRLVEGYWVGVSGASGGTGENGGGGGGGGGAGGCDNGFLPGDNSYGGGGGGGGAGGCAAQSGGGGGGAGGSSFAIFIVGSNGVIVRNCELVRGNGGAGGIGGAGGRGQSGGPGGSAGAHASTTTLPAGPGGAGGHGGHGGGGGGGAGGLSFGIFAFGADVDASSTSVSGGAAGTPGSGGLSAAGAPVAERDGNDGSVGVAGEQGDLFTCVAADAC